MRKPPEIRIIASFINRHQENIGCAASPSCSTSSVLVPPAAMPLDPPQNGQEFATLAGGCFWCLEAVFDELEGVTDVVSGYAGGHAPDPDYRQVCSGDSGYAEVVQVRFDPP